MRIDSNDLIQNDNSKQSEINEATVKIIFTVKMKHNNSLYIDARNALRTLPNIYGVFCKNG